jgi:hypothetical protein
VLLVSRAGVEAAGPSGQRILSLVIGPLPNLTKRYEPVFTRLAVVKYRFGWLHIKTYRHHLSPIFSYQALEAEARLPIELALV